MPIKIIQYLALASLGLSFASTALARDLPARRQTSLTLEFSYQDVTPTETSHVTVPVGEIITISGRFTSFAAFSAVQWLRNGQPIPEEEGTQLQLGFITPEDAGIYAARLTLTTGQTVLSQSLALTVASPGALPSERLANLSVLRALPAGLGEGLVAGFVVIGRVPKKMIIRAVGPSLGQFGVGSVLKRPVMLIRDAAGRPYEPVYVYPVIDGAVDYERDLADSLARVGAFRTAAGSADVTKLLPMAPGNYTVEITSADATAGTVLFEVYDVP